MGLVTPEGGLEHYDGLLRVMDSDGKVLETGAAAGALPRDHRRGRRAVDLSEVPVLQAVLAYSDERLQRACTGSARWRA